MRYYNFLQLGLSPRQVDEMHPQISEGLLHMMKLINAKEKEDSATSKFYAEHGAKVGR